MLWYSNPYHFLTGWVEASISNGKPSQLNKFHGGEHPMWLVTGRSPQTAGRDSWTGSGMIDAFFDCWLPVFVHEMRMLTHLKANDDKEAARKKAEDLYEEVISTDGISKPSGKIGRDKYGGEDLLTKYDKIGKTQRKDLAYKVGPWHKMSKSAFGKCLAKIAQGGQDMHAKGGSLEGK